jgi:hypothetical protein
MAIDQRQISVVALLLAGCVGEAHVRFVGRVVRAESGPSYGFELEQSSDEEPIEGAEVRLHAASKPDEQLCSRRGLRPSPLGRASNHAITDENGRYDVSAMFGGIIGIDTYLFVCVEHPEFEWYQYSTIFGNTAEPTNGRAYLVIRLQPLPGAIRTFGPLFQESYVENAVRGFDWNIFTEENSDLGKVLEQTSYRNAPFERWSYGEHNSGRPKVADAGYANYFLPPFPGTFLR